MNIAVIPARGGSKRIPRKNIKEFHGKPMIAWAIEAAKRANIFDDIIVSTDDEEIAKIAINYGASVPFIRPVELADDYADTKSVICHAIEWLELNNIKPSIVCCIYATNPFLQSNDLIEAMEKCNIKKNGYVLSITSYDYPIERALTLNPNRELEPLNSKSILSRSQDLEEYYHDAGQFYIAYKEQWSKEESILNETNIPIIIPRHRTQDIDSMEDWLLAEKLFQAQNT